MDTSRFTLAGKVVVVVGAGSGIGKAVAVGCAEHGGALVCFDLKPESAEQTAAEIRSNDGLAEAAGLDITDGAAVEKNFADVRAHHERFDVLVCTPGINIRKPLLDYTDDEFAAVLELNLKGSLHCMQSAGRLMVKQGSGSIIMFSSIRSLVVEPGQGAYAATKAGIVQMVRTLAAELGAAGVRVNAVAPGVVDTPLTAPIKNNADWYSAYAAKTIMGRWARADELVGPTVFLASDASSYVTGSVLFVDGGWTAVDGRFQPPGM